MKIYKYRDFSNPGQADFNRLETMLRRRVFWCARPDTLNDPQEFAWKCDYRASPDTVNLLTELLMRQLNREFTEARRRALDVVEADDLHTLAEPIILDMIKRCRDEVGVACFGTSSDNETLWERYGGHGAGVCLELEVPERLVGTELHRVQYWEAKGIHIDQLLRAHLDPSRVSEVYALSLLSKPKFWEPEGEIRFVSQKQKVGVVIDGSAITCVILGNSLAKTVADQVSGVSGAVPIVARKLLKNA
jgi:hypothetical protein